MRTILHCDCNSFFASVEALDNPELKNVPMAVGGSVESRKGIILAKNESAKKYGVVTAETIWSAKKKCPNLIVVPPRHKRYVEISEKVNNIYKEYTEFVEPFGIDESWLDVTGVGHLFGSGEKIANEIRRRVSSEIGITVSVGVSFTKSFAKLGSDYKKPDATTVITKDNIKSIVYPQRLGNLLFAGKKICEEFSKFGIITIGDLAAADVRFVEKNFGKNGMLLYNYAKGNDDDPVKSIYEKEDVKSVGNSYTFAEDLHCDDEIHGALMWLSDVVSSRMRKIGVKCNVVSVVIKDENFKSITRQISISQPTNNAGELFARALELVEKNRSKTQGIRMLGICGSNLVCDGKEQISLFGIAEDDKREKLDRAIDSLRAKFGESALKFASEGEYHTKYAETDEVDN